MDTRLLVCRTKAADLDQALTAALAKHGFDVASSTVGPRPDKVIDPLLTTSVLVVGDDADLAAVVLRLLRKDRLADVVVGYVPVVAGPVATRFGLTTGAGAVSVAATGTAQEVTLVRDDAGGILLGQGLITPVGGPVYVDEHRLADVPTAELTVLPSDVAAGGVSVSAQRKRLLGLGRRTTERTGRATQIAGPAMQIVRDGVPYPRPMDRWTWYRHTAPLLLRLP